MANMTFKTNLLPNSTTLEYSLGSENQPWKINGYSIEDTYVKKVGDTMTGTLTITKSTDSEFIKLARTNLTKGTIPNENQWSGIYFIDSSLNLDINGGRFGALQVKQEPNGNNNISLQATTNAVGSNVLNQLNLGISSTGTCYYSVSDPAAFRTALGLGARATDSTEYLPLAGGTMTGALNTANGIWNVMGDDSQIGDINEAGTLGLQGRNGNTAIRFTTYNQSNKTTGGKITWDGNNFIFTNLTQSNMIFPYHEVTSFNANSATSGIYSCKCSVTNAPVTNHGVLIDFHFVGTPFQIFMPDNINYMYKRWYTSGAWTAWKIMNAAWA